MRNIDKRRVFDAEGQLLARSGPVVLIFEILFDHGGTPSDPSDDEFLEFLGFLSSSGDFDSCPYLVEKIG